LFVSAASANGHRLADLERRKNQVAFAVTSVGEDELIGARLIARCHCERRPAIGERDVPAWIVNKGDHGLHVAVLLVLPLVCHPLLAHPGYSARPTELDASGARSDTVGTGRFQ
jgi:hypothetical protein